MDFRPLRGCSIAAAAFILILCGIGMINDYSKNKIIKEYKTTIIHKDSIYNKTVDSLNNVILETENNAKYFEYLLHCNDLVLDSVSEELEVSKVKLERIREYNRIAGQGNNIKFLRGWINRVLNE